MAYPFNEIEPKWQDHWRENHSSRAPLDSSKPKYYVMDMLPYPSGAGLHMGHPFGYTGTDIIARYKKMNGFNVLHPMGWDAFGLPAEQYAVKMKLHPSITTAENIINFRKQLDMLGYGYDWDREINSTDPDFFKWTQWIFLKIYNSYFDTTENKAKPIEGLIRKFEAEGGDGFSATDWTSFTNKRKADILANFRLAYLHDAPVNWCPELGTVLANEEVPEQEEKGFTVIRRNMRQWMLRITAYADRLLQDFELIDWPHHTVEQQRNWIGKSTGAEIDFAIDGHNEAIRVYTTRPDTIFGATYMVLAPEHSLVDVITTTDQKKKVEEYKERSATKSELERTDLAKSKTGCATGAYAINPASGEKIPIWIADYVLISYGTGAIMAVPAHDERDYEFAEQFKLPVIDVVDFDQSKAQDPEAFWNDVRSDEGVAMNSSSTTTGLDFNGLPTAQAKEKVIGWVEEKGIGKKAIKFRLRDWLFSRQRYWGEPFPIIYVNDGDGEYAKALNISDLPVTLPEVKSYAPSGTGESPLAVITNWVNTTDPETGKPAKRETNTMPQWAGSSWYYLRYADANNSKEAISKEADDYWNPVDLYIGGNEHAVTHLLYSRFWHKMLYDFGVVHYPEPFKKLFHQGMLLGENGAKMSKSLGNVVNPDDIIAEYGADTLRMYLMFLGPLDQGGPWNTKGISGVHRFLNRLWRLVADDETKETHNRWTNDAPNTAQERVMHQTIKKIRQDIDDIHFNTAISQLMIFMNEVAAGDNPVVPKVCIETMVQLVAPFAPHITEELWGRLGNSGSVFDSVFPEYDEAKTIENTVTLILQVNGKVRDKLEVPRGLSREELEKFATGNDKITKYVGDLSIKKLIVVPDKLVNVVVG
ncbi:MAG TPA: leucine--tRNA ligase [Candidatus Kapabacteria bacterium]